MKKTTTFNEVEYIFNCLSQEWVGFVKEIHLSNKDLYNLIALKRAIEEKHQIIQETVATIMRSHGAEENEQGILKVGEDKINVVNAELTKLSKEEIEIEFTPVKLREQDSIPTALMDILYDFIVIE